MAVISDYTKAGVDAAISSAVSAHAGAADPHPGYATAAEAAAAAPVQSVAGRGGAVTLTSSDVTNFAEAVQDAVAAMLTSGTNVTLTYDDAAGTLSVTAAGGDAEVMRDTIGAALVGVNGVTVTVNDAADTITLSVTGLTIAQVTGLQGALDGKAPALGADDNYVTDAEKARLSTTDTKTVNTITAAASVTVSTAYAVNKLTMTQDTTITPSLAAGSDPITALHLSGAFVPTFAASIEWPDGTAPAYTGPAVYVFLTVDAGTTWQGVQSGKAFA